MKDAETSEPMPTTPDTVSSLIFSTHGSNALRRWSEPYDRSSLFPPFVMSSSDTNENLSSSSEVMLPSTSDAGSDVDYTSNFSVASNHLWTTQDAWPDQISQTMISDGPPRIMYAWTPRVMMTGRSRVRYLAGHNNSPTDVCTQLFHDVSDIRRSISCPPSWNRIILNYAVSQANHRPLQANHRSPIPSNEVVQHRNISPVTDNAINPVQHESNRGETSQTDTNNEHLSRALTLRPSMDTQFATLIDIIRRPPLRRSELVPSDAITIASTPRSLAPILFPDHAASTMQSSDSYFHPCMAGPIVDHPISHQDWHDEVCDWFDDESSVSSSYTNDSSETSTSDTACISSSSLDLSQTAHDRSLTVTAMSPLSRSLSLIRLAETPETCPFIHQFSCGSKHNEQTTYFF